MGAGYIVLNAEDPFEVIDVAANKEDATAECAKVNAAYKQWHRSYRVYELTEVK